MAEHLIRHRIFQDLRDEIISCELPPGAEIRENELAQHFGVSKSPIRDALQKLEFEGLVEISPRRGHRVAPISVSDAEDILEMRTILEAAAVRKVAIVATDKQLQSLDDFRQANTSGMREFSAYNRRFHHLLCDLSGNERLSASMGRVMENYDRLCSVSLSARTQHTQPMEAALADHVRIIDALQERNGTAAARLSGRHIGRSRKQVMRELECRPIVG